MPQTQGQGRTVQGQGQGIASLSTKRKFEDRAISRKWQKSGGWPCDLCQNHSIQGQGQCHKLKAKAGQSKAKARE